MNPHFTRELPCGCTKPDSRSRASPRSTDLAPARGRSTSRSTSIRSGRRARRRRGHGRARQCNAYPDVKLAALRARRGAWRHDRGQLFFGAGLDDVIKQLLHAWAAQGEAVLVHLPTFPRYELEARLARLPRRGRDGSDPPWRVDLEAIAEALARERIALAFCARPNNPTGEKIDGPPRSPSLARRFAGHAVRGRRSAARSARGRRHGRSSARRRTWCMLRTFSKYYGLAGFRIGYAHADRARWWPLPSAGGRRSTWRCPAKPPRVAALADRAFLDAAFGRFRAEADRVAALARVPALRLRGRHANMLLLEVRDRTSRDCSDAPGGARHRGRRCGVLRRHGGSRGDPRIVAVDRARTSACSPRCPRSRHDAAGG